MHESLRQLAELLIYLDTPLSWSFCIISMHVLIEHNIIIIMLLVVILPADIIFDSINNNNIIDYHCVCYKYDLITV